MNNRSWKRGRDGRITLIKFLEIFFKIQTPDFSVNVRKYTCTLITPRAISMIEKSIYPLSSDLRKNVAPIPFSFLATPANQLKFLLCSIVLRSSNENLIALDLFIKVTRLRAVRYFGIKPSLKLSRSIQSSIADKKTVARLISTVFTSRIYTGCLETFNKVKV